MSVDGEDRDQMVNRKAEVRRASRANAARPTTMRGAVWVRPQPAGIIHQSPRKVPHAPSEVARHPRKRTNRHQPAGLTRLSWLDRPRRLLVSLIQTRRLSTSTQWSSERVPNNTLLSDRSRLTCRVSTGQSFVPRSSRVAEPVIQQAPSFSCRCRAP